LEIFTFFAAVYCISHRPPDYRKRQRFYMIYGGILLILVTIDVALDCLWGEYMWIDHRNYPGGPPKFFVASEFT
jgi:cell division protein FtsW (lipid II flippase)